MKTIPKSLILVCIAAMAMACSREAGETPTSAATGGDTTGEDNLRGTIAFSAAQIYLEYNSTADDAGVQVFLDAEDWKQVSIQDGRGRELLEIETGGGMRELGLTELRFEGAEPAPAEVLDAFPAGEYGLRGITVDRERLIASATLSHEIPAAPVFSPSQGETVDPDQVIIEWDPVGGVDRYQVIVESDANTLSLEVSVASSVHSLRIPATFLVPNTLYKAEVLAIAPSGNRTITEGTFFTGP